VEDLLLTRLEKGMHEISAGHGVAGEKACGLAYAKIYTKQAVEAGIRDAKSFPGKEWTLQETQLFEYVANKIRAAIMAPENT
jgi:hypothetical protein